MPASVIFGPLDKAVTVLKSVAECLPGLQVHQHGAALPSLALRSGPAVPSLHTCQSLNPTRSTRSGRILAHERPFRGLPYLKPVLTTSCLASGASSRALLHILASLRNQNSARKSRGLTSFRLSAVYVDESAAMDASAEEGAAAAAAVERSCAAGGGYDGVSLHVARLEDAYAGDVERQSTSAQQAGPASAARREKLQALLKVRSCCCPQSTGPYLHRIYRLRTSICLLPVSAESGSAHGRSVWAKRPLVTMTNAFAS